MRLKTSELTGPALDWAVAMADEQDEDYVLDPEQFQLLHEGDEFTYSTNWKWGGPIIEQESINLHHFRFDQPAYWVAAIQHPTERRKAGGVGPTPLIAAMRCFVASKLGDEVDIPEQLCKGD